MIRLIDGFQYLSIASVITQLSFMVPDYKWLDAPALSVRAVRRLRSGTFTCRYLLSNSSSKRELYLWIGEQVSYITVYFHLCEYLLQPSQSWRMKHLPPRRGYLWYRSTSILSECLSNTHLYKFITQIWNNYRSRIKYVCFISVIVVINLVLCAYAYLMCINMPIYYRWFAIALGLICSNTFTFVAPIADRLFSRITGLPVTSYSLYFLIICIWFYVLF